jgi:hypothetical protein
MSTSHAMPGTGPRCQSLIILEVKSIIELIWPSAFTTIDSMPRVRKPNPPADILSPTPTPPAELVQQFTSQRDIRALAASSTAIALPFGSPIYGTRDASNNEATVRGRDTGWQSTYAAARMAVEIAKESSDMFPPLKAVVGAMSVLIKNCDVGVSCS